MATDPFRSFLCTEICRDLVSSDIKDMAFCINGHVDSQKLENVTTGTELMELAMTTGLFTETDTSQLEEMLKAANRQNLVRKVKEYKKNIRVLPSQGQAPCNLEENMIGRMYMVTQTSDELTTAIKADNVIILSGVLGSGKTQLAVHYGYEFHNNDPTSTVWMMRSKDQASLQTCMTTLANQLGILKGKDKESVNPINALGDIIANALIEKETTTSHIIIFDDVNGEECQRIVEDLVKKFVPLKAPQGSIKVIITTMDDLMTLPRTKRIAVSGFTKEEAITFLNGNKTCNDSEKDALEMLAKRMSFLPLGLSCVKTYMVNCCKSGKAFLKLLNANTLEKLDGKLAQCDESKRGLFSALNTLIRFMEKDLDEDATEMFQMTQFLENENIPIILFELLSPSSTRCSEDADQDIEHDDVEPCYSLSADSLVQSVQKFSFGTVQGIDDRRMLNTHTAVSLTLQAFTDDETKRRLLKRLLWPFALIMDKDNRHKDDYSRMVSVLPHARSVLRHAETLMKEDVELYLLMSFVNDLVAYINDFEGLVVLEKYHSEKALWYCYKIMETTENELNEEVSVKHMCTTSAAHREFAKTKATAIDKKLTGIRLLREQKIAKFIKHFILQKKRTQADVKFLTEYFEDYDGEALTMQQYETLCEKKKAVPLTDLIDHFIKEMIMSTFYTYGRRIFYMGRCADSDEKRKCIHYLYLADALGEILRSKCPESIPLYCMLAKISGTLELVFGGDMPELGLATVNSLQNTAEEFEQLLNDPSCYYIFGIFKIHAASDRIHTATCLKQLLRTYMELFKLCKNPSDDQTDIITKGKGIIKKLESIEIVSYDSKNRGIWSRVGLFQFAVGDTKGAEIAYRRVCPSCLLEGDVKSRFVSKHELTAAYGLVECYNKDERKELAKCTLQKLLKMLPDIQMQEKENVRKQIGLLDTKN